MSGTPALKPAQMPADSKPTLDTLTKNIGFTPNMMATLAQSPMYRGRQTACEARGFSFVRL